SDVAMEEANDYFRTTLYPAACAFWASASPYAGSSELSVLPATSCVTTVFDQTGWSGYVTMFQPFQTAVAAACIAGPSGAAKYGSLFSADNHFTAAGPYDG